MRYPPIFKPRVLFRAILKFTADSAAERCAERCRARKFFSIIKQAERLLQSEIQRQSCGEDCADFTRRLQWIEQSSEALYDLLEEISCGRTTHEGMQLFDELLDVVSPFSKIHEELSEIRIDLSINRFMRSV